MPMEARMAKNILDRFALAQPVGNAANTLNKHLVLLHISAQKHIHRAVVKHFLHHHACQGVGLCHIVALLQTVL